MHLKTAIRQRILRFTHFVGHGSERNRPIHRCTFKGRPFMTIFAFQILLETDESSHILLSSRLDAQWRQKIRVLIAGITTQTEVIKYMLLSFSLSSTHKIWVYHSVGHIHSLPNDRSLLFVHFRFTCIFLLCLSSVRTTNAYG